MRANSNRQRRRDREMEREGRHMDRSCKTRGWMDMADRERIRKRARGWIDEHGERERGLDRTQQTRG